MTHFVYVYVKLKLDLNVVVLGELFFRYICHTDFPVIPFYHEDV